MSTIEGLDGRGAVLTYHAASSTARDVWFSQDVCDAYIAAVALFEELVATHNRGKQTRKQWKIVKFPVCDFGKFKESLKPTEKRSGRSAVAVMTSKQLKEQRFFFV